MREPIAMTNIEKLPLSFIVFNLFRWTLNIGSSAIALLAIIRNCLEFRYGNLLTPVLDSYDLLQRIGQSILRSGLKEGIEDPFIYISDMESGTIALLSLWGVTFVDSHLFECQVCDPKIRGNMDLFASIVLFVAIRTLAILVFVPMYGIAWALPDTPAVAVVVLGSVWACWQLKNSSSNSSQLPANRPRPKFLREGLEGRIETPEKEIDESFTGVMIGPIRLPILLSLANIPVAMLFVLVDYFI